jgi:hypothetical protein
MTTEEFEYLKRALEALQTDLSPMSRVKVLRTMSQICEKTAADIEYELVDKIDSVLYNT